MAATYSLKVVSLDGLEFEGEVERLMVRTVHGDIEILARHINYCTAVGMGTARIVLADGTEKKAACIGGMLSMMNGNCRLFPTTWEWDDEIDLERAQNAKERAEERLRDINISNEARSRAEAKLYRALIRIGTANK